MTDEVESVIKPPVPGTPEHDAAMIAIAKGSTRVDEEGNVIVIGEETPAADDGVTPRPDDIPEKFWNAKEGKVNVEALLKSQADSEAAFRATQAKPKETPPADDAEGEAKPAEQAQAGAVGDASAEFAEKGELTDATYEKLAAQGLDRTMVDAYIEGQTAKVNVLKQTAYEPFEGSEEGYMKAAQWANVNMTEAEISALDVQLTSTNPAIIAEGAKALAAKYLEGNPSEGTTIRGDSTVASSGDMFKDATEVRIAMNNPLYKSSEAYRQEVAGKIDRANKAGVVLFG